MELILLLIGGGIVLLVVLIAASFSIQRAIAARQRSNELPAPVDPYNSRTTIDPGNQYPSIPVPNPSTTPLPPFPASNSSYSNGQGIPNQVILPSQATS